jgi:3-oxoadipate CoA-transferase beta subunit
MTQPLSRLQIAWRIAQDIANGSYVNLGAGMPVLVADYVPADREVIFHSENGILGMGPKPEPGAEDDDLINAGAGYATLLPGGCFFHHADSFAMIRGGHIDICVLGAYQVSERGDLANWILPDSNTTPAIGGAMDLVAGSKQVFVIMEHCSRDGAPKILKECSLPLTGVRCVNAIYTDLCVIDVTDSGLLVREMIDGMDIDTLQSRTGADIRLAEDWKVLAVPPIETGPA